MVGVSVEAVCHPEDGMHRRALPDWHGSERGDTIAGTEESQEENRQLSRLCYGLPPQTRSGLHGPSGWRASLVASWVLELRLEPRAIGAVGQRAAVLIHKPPDCAGRDCVGSQGRPLDKVRSSLLSMPLAGDAVDIQRKASVVGQCVAEAAQEWGRSSPNAQPSVCKPG